MKMVWTRKWNGCSSLSVWLWKFTIVRFEVFHVKNGYEWCGWDKLSHSLIPPSFLEQQKKRTTAFVLFFSSSFYFIVEHCLIFFHVFFFCQSFRHRQMVKIDERYKHRHSTAKPLGIWERKYEVREKGQKSRSLKLNRYVQDR